MKEWRQGLIHENIYEYKKKDFSFFKEDLSIKQVF